MDTPNDCVPVLASEFYRFKHYKPISIQRKKGILGRWQRWNGYGWDNVSTPVAWEYCEKVNLPEFRDD